MTRDEQTPLCACHGAPVADGATLCITGTDDLRDLLAALTATVARGDREPRRDDAGRIVPGDCGRYPSSRWDTPSGEVANLPRMLAESTARLAVRSSQARLSVAKPEPPLPLDVRAAERATGLRVVVGRWAARLSGLDAAPDQPWDVAAVAAWLEDSLPEIRQREWAGTMLVEVKAAVQAATRHVDRTPDRVYLGVCRATAVWEPNPEADPPGAELVERQLPAPCPGQVFAVENALRGRCRDCGTWHDVEAMRQRRQEQLSGMLLTAAEIERVTTSLGQRVPRTTIETWADRGRLFGVTGGEGPARYDYDRVCELAAEVAVEKQRRAEAKAQRAARKHAAA